MRSVFIGLLALTVVTLVGCAVVRTRQFVLTPSETAKQLEAGGWQIQSPRVVAFREVVKLSSIPDTNQFYLSLRAQRAKKSDWHTNLLIDSALFGYCVVNIPQFNTGDSTGFRKLDTTFFSEWRHVTRAEQYSLDEWSYFSKEFDFFGDQGVVIPLDVWSLQVSFDAVVLDSSDGTRKDYPITLKLTREEDSTKVPFRAR